MNESAQASPPTLDSIIANIFEIKNPQIDESRKESISSFIKTTINGDVVKAELTIDVSLGADKKGIFVYILTNERLIKVEIDDKEVTSTSFLLKTKTGVERKLTAENRASTRVYFQTGSLGLTYSPDNKKISDFFQKVDQAKVENNA